MDPSFVRRNLASAALALLLGLLAVAGAFLGRPGRWDGRSLALLGIGALLVVLALAGPVALLRAARARK